MWTLLLIFVVLALLLHLAKGTKPTAPPPDDEDATTRRRATPRTPTLRITYRDFEGQETTRDVSPYTKATNERFRAYCHLRKEAREFVFARVQGGVDLQTGEVLDRAGVFKHIHPTRNVPEDLL